jgi:hypothetical protein
MKSSKRLIVRPQKSSIEHRAASFEIFLPRLLILWFLSSVISFLIVFLLTSFSLLLRCLPRLTHLLRYLSFSIFNSLRGGLAVSSNWGNPRRNSISLRLSSLRCILNVSLLMRVEVRQALAPSFCSDSGAFGASTQFGVSTVIVVFTSIDFTVIVAVQLPFDCGLTV